MALDKVRSHPETMAERLARENVQSFPEPHDSGGPLADWQIRERLGRKPDDPYRLAIQPFAEATKRPGEVSYGLTSYGYDLRLGRKFMIFSDCAAVVVDPVKFDPSRFVHHEGDECLIPPNSFILAESMEYVRIPRDCIGIIVGKSTYARTGIGLTCTPIEPEWHGIITIEIANHTRLPAVVRAGQGIGQLMFHSGSEVCEKSYADKPHAMYQGQTGLTAPRV